MWKILDSYFQENGLAFEQINSYNRFILDIAEVIKDYGSFIINAKDQYVPGKKLTGDISYEFQLD